jgi:hypothetical protein
MKTPAIVASLTVVGSLAYAAGSQGNAGKQSPLMPSGSLAHSMQEDMTQGRMQMSMADCTPDLTEIWFAPTPRLITCNTPFGTSVTTQNSSAVDINGDGHPEYWQSRRSSILAVWNGAPNAAAEDGPDSGVLTINAINELGGVFQVQAKQVPVFSPSIGEWCLANLPAPAAPNRTMRIYIYRTEYSESWSGWRDVDGDGDLDLVCMVTDDSTWNAQIWFENIGYEKPAPPLAADINRDGRVDGADLGLVLVSWGTNP